MSKSRPILDVKANIARANAERYVDRLVQFKLRKFAAYVQAVAEISTAALNVFSAFSIARRADVSSECSSAIVSDGLLILGPAEFDRLLSQHGESAPRNR
jgi:hypothetical protein